MNIVSDLQLKLLATHFKDLASRSANITINKESFLKFFNLPGILGERLFDAFDINKNGEIEYQEFLLGIGKSIRGSRREKLKILFSLCDLTSDGYIHIEELITLLYNLPKSTKIKEVMNNQNTNKNPDHIKKQHQNSSQIQSESVLLQQSPTYKIVNNENQSLTSEQNNSQYHHSPTQIHQIASTMILSSNTCNSTSSTDNNAKGKLLNINTCNNNNNNDENKLMNFDQFLVWVGKNTEFEKLFSDVFQQSKWAEPNKEVKTLRTKRSNSSFGFCCGTGKGSRRSFSKVVHDSRPQFYLKSQKIKKQGYLRITQRSHTKKARKYYAVLNDTTLYLYKQAHYQLPQKTIFLFGCFMQQIPFNESAGGYGLKIDHSFDGFSTIFIFCSDKSQIAQWKAMIQKGTRIYDINSDYTIGQQLGAGKFSRVFKGKNKITGQMVAIKKIDKTNLTPHQKQLLRTEIAILKTVNHPHIVQLKELYQTKQVTYMVLEYIGGGELFDYIFDKQRLQQQEIAKIVYQLLITLDYIHKCGIIHRDIKPENILIQFDPQNLQIIDKVKITDFGLSKMVSPNQKIQQACGTLAYVAPEVLGYNGYRKEVDIWSLGILMYLLRTGTLPFNSKVRKETVNLILNRQIDFLHSSWKGFSEEGKEFLKQLLKKNPQQRPSVQQLLQHEWFSKNHREIKERHIYTRQKQRSPVKGERHKPPRKISSFKPESQVRQILHQFHESNLRLDDDDDNDDNEERQQNRNQQLQDENKSIEVKPFDS